MQMVVINDTNQLDKAELVSGKLVKDYGIRAYVGVPLIDAQGYCLGALAVMDLMPRNFSTRDIEFLQIIARWSMSEFERNRLLQEGTAKNISSKKTNNFEESTTSEIKISAPAFQDSVFTSQLKLQLLGQLTQELRTPLTSVLGMASVLGREIYGPLTTKQREYLEIIQHSGRYLLSLVNEISELGAMDDTNTELNLAPVDIEMLCQQAINTLEEAAARREQDIRLSIEPGRNRILPLDKDKVRQILYHLIFSVIQLSATGSVVRIHVSYKEDALLLTIWVSHPWLGEGITEVDPYLRLSQISSMELSSDINSAFSTHPKSREKLNGMASKSVIPITENISSGGIAVDSSDNESNSQSGGVSRETLGLLLSCQLAELHGGDITIQGSQESGYRYVLSLPLNQGNTQAVADA